MTWRRLLFAGALGSALVLTGSAARAEDPADADTLFKNGVKDLNDKKLDRACPALRESYRLDHRAVVLYYLASCEEQSGKVASALRTYDDYLAAFDKLSPSEQKEESQREQQATERREALQRVIPQVTLKLPSDAPDGTKLTRTSVDGLEVAVAINVPLPVDPGEVIIHVKAPGRPDWDHRFFVNQGDKKTVEVPVPPPDRRKDQAARVDKPLEPVPSYLPTLDDSGSSAQRYAAFAVGAGGAAILVMGGVAGAVTWAQKGPVEANCKDRLCNKAGEAAANTAKDWGIVSEVMFPIGGAALVTGLILYLTVPAPSKLSAVPSRIAARPTGVDVTWRW